MISQWSFFKSIYCTGIWFKSLTLSGHSLLHPLQKSPGNLGLGFHLSSSGNNKKAQLYYTKNLSHDGKENSVSNHIIFRLTYLKRIRMNKQLNSVKHINTSIITSTCIYKHTCTNDILKLTVVCCFILFFSQKSMS